MRVSATRERELRDLLSGGDRRSTGKADEIALRIASDPALFAAAIRLIGDQDPIVRMRSADAAEKASRAEPGLLAPHKAALLGMLAEDEQQEVRWHLLQLLPRLALSANERETAYRIAERSLDHRSRIVQAEALSAMIALANGEPAIQERALKAAEGAISTGSPALRARARKLLRLPSGGWGP